MPCYKPLHAILRKLPSGKNTLSFQARLPLKSKGESMVPLPCGQCVGCRLERSRQWAVRLVKECKLHDRSSFLTLTYDDQHLHVLPNGLPTLVLEDVQLFLKKLRKHFSPHPLRFFQCGEYGEKTKRPHHHMILFGQAFDKDREPIEDSRSGFPQWQSPTLTRLWGLGRATISEFSFETAAYTARYALKKITGSAGKLHYNGRKPEFVTMSRRPGIAAGYFEEYGSDIYPSDSVVPDIGRPASLPPKYFDKLLERVDPALYESVKKKRVEGLDYFTDLDSTDTRLETRERVHQAKIKNCLKRELE